jgi:hypothetical protein
LPATEVDLRRQNPLADLQEQAATSNAC